MFRGIPAIRKRDAKKFATTTITNELADAVNSLGHGGHIGQTDDDRLAVPNCQPVRLEEPEEGVDGGSDGDDDTQASYKYVVKDLFGNVLFDTDTDPMTPEMQRENGSKQRAKIGLVVFDTDDTPKLWWCDEVDNTGGDCGSSS